MENNQIIKCFGKDYQAMTENLLRKAELEKEILKKTGKPKEAIRIVIKPNLVAPVPACFGATTHPELIEGLVLYLRENGFSDIVIAEGSWVGDSTEEAFEYCGYRDLEKRLNITLLDTKKEKSHLCSCSGMDLRVCDIVSSMDFLINVPVLKGHCQTKVTCALKNMKGLIPDSEKRRFHSLGLHQPIAHLNTGIRQDFILVDDICGDPDFEEGGNPRNRNCIFAAKDPVLTDALACYELGWRPEDVPYIGLAEKLGAGKTTGEEIIVLCGKESDAGTGRSGKILDVSYAVEDSDTCSACYSSLTEALLRLKEEGLSERIDFRIGIGQGMRGKSGEIGVGTCTSGFRRSVPGCPPDSETVCSFLKQIILKNEKAENGK